MGIKGRVQGATVAVGNLALMKESGISELGAIRGICQSEEEKGRTVVLVARGNSVLGALSLGDTPKPDGLSGISRLKAMGIEPITILTGDNERAAANVATAVGIGTYMARLVPQQKLDAIAKLKSSGVRVAMVGDGINDAPALAAADVGIAMGARGSSIAIETADVAIMSDRVSGVAEALDTGRRTLAAITQNVWAALVINLVAVILASTGALTPVTGALWHNVGSVAVVLNSARLIRRPQAVASPATALGETSRQ
jgi:P-type E1-E2 ATPase